MKFAKEVFDRRAIWPTARRDHHVLGTERRPLSMVFQGSDSEFQPDASDWMSRNAGIQFAVRGQQNAANGTGYALSSGLARNWAGTERWGCGGQFFGFRSRHNVAGMKLGLCRYEKKGHGAKPPVE